MAELVYWLHASVCCKFAVGLPAHDVLRGKWNAGNTVAMVGLDQFITKNATLTNDKCEDAHPHQGHEVQRVPSRARGCGAQDCLRPAQARGR